MKPRVIVLGGCGFIGRNLVNFLIVNDLVESVRVVDKVPPEIAWLNANHKSSFSDPRVSFKSANLTNPDSCKLALASDELSGTFDYVINCAGETKLGQTDPIYKEGILQLSSLCAKEAALNRMKHYIEISSGSMSSNGKIPQKEDSEKEPWTDIAKWKSHVEEYLATIPNLSYTVLRPAIVYGIGDKTGLTPRLLIGAIYKHLGECMKLLWTQDLKMNTVHVEDVCRAIWHVLTKENPKGQIYNVVDESNTTQGSADLGSLVEEVNDKHMTPWAEICSKDGIQNTPLSPYIDKDLLSNKHLYLDGTKLRMTGFTYSTPQLTAECLKEVLLDYGFMRLFPLSLLT